MFEKFLNVLFILITLVGMVGFISAIISYNKILGYILGGIYIFSFLNFISCFKEFYNGKEN